MQLLYRIFIICQVICFNMIIFQFVLLYLNYFSVYSNYHLFIELYSSTPWLTHYL
nr:MAG TPA: hypothetical protein [Caudoviricetes sp.]